MFVVFTDATSVQPDSLCGTVVDCNILFDNNDIMQDTVCFLYDIQCM